MTASEFNGVAYNDDRMFILYICKCTIEEDDEPVRTIIHHQEIPSDYIWSVAIFKEIESEAVEIPEIFPVFSLVIRETGERRVRSRLYPPPNIKKPRIRGVF